MSSFDAMARRHLARPDLAERQRLDRLLEDLMPVFDALDRLLADGGADGPGAGRQDPTIGSARGIARLLEQAAATAGLRRFGTAGETLDLDRHLVVGTGPGRAEVVVAVERSGYERDDRVIRPAEVVVGRDGAGERR